MGNNSSENRRRLFLQAIGMGAAGLAVGGGASWLYGEMTGGKPAAGIPANAIQQTDTPAYDTGRVFDLQGQIAQLNNQVNAASGQNQQLNTLLKASEDENLRLKQQLSDLQGQLSVSEAKLTDANGVISLYDQLEAIGLDDVANNGLQTFAGALAATVGLLPATANGIANSRSLLDQLDAQMPDLKGGVSWLAERVLNLKVGLFSLETAAAALNGAAAGGVSAAFGGFAKYIVNYLPFDIGQKIRDAMSATQNLVDSNAALSSDVDQKVFEKLSPHFSDGPSNLKVKVLDPVRAEGLQAAGDLVNSVSQADASYQSTLAQPLKSAIDQRAALRQQLQAARSKLG